MRLLSVFRLSVVLWCGLAGLHAGYLHAQSTATDLPEFEVASVKPHIRASGPPQVSMTDEHGRVVYMNVTLRTCIRKAYGLKVYPLSLGPDPLSTDRYDIVAKAPGDPPKEQTMRMLQRLLADRFHLAVHRETKELPIYELVKVKNSPKLRAVTDDGSAAQIDSSDGHPINAHHASMKQLAATLSGYIGDKVGDATDLSGLFDFSLDFTLDESPSAEGPTVFEAVQQLGLRLEAHKGPVEVIVIDHVEKPTAN